MSAVAAIQFDPVFSMGSRSSFSWPVVESQSGLLGHDLNSYGSDASLTPPSQPRSITSSPPRAIRSTEARELKRQRDQARRESKAAYRMKRSGSGGSPTMVPSPPVTMADLAAQSSMPVYTTGPSSMTLLSEPTSLAASPYLPATYSPPLSDHSPSMFPSPYQQPYMDYASSNPAPAGAGLPSHYGYVDSSVQDLLHDGERRTNGNGCSRSLGGETGLLYPMPPVMSDHASMGGRLSVDGAGAGGVRVVQTRPKPQCWEHGCNGRQFSTFSNLLRHQREKSGQATKAVCPNCGAEFTRTTARNGHLQHDKCKQRRTSS